MAENDNPDNERLRKFESALDPITKFMPKLSREPVKTEAPIAVTIAAIKEQATLILKACEEADVAIAASEDSARKAADNLMELIKRVK
jgi:hypothetical protein